MEQIGKEDRHGSGHQEDAPDAVVQPDLHDGGLWRARKHAADSLQLAGMRGLMAKPSGEIIEQRHHGKLP